MNLSAERPAGYVYADNRAVVICNGLRETLEVIAEERRATRMQQHHVFGGFTESSGDVVLFAGTQDDMLSVRISSMAFAEFRSEFENG